MTAPTDTAPAAPVVESWMDAAWLAADTADAAAYGTHDVPTDVIQYQPATRGPRWRLDDADTADLAAARRAGRIL